MLDVILELQKDMAAASVALGLELMSGDREAEIARRQG